MQRKFKLGSDFWIYFLLSILFVVIMFVYFFATDHWTGEKNLSEFSKDEWKLFYIFLATEALLLFNSIFFALKAGKIYKKNEKDKTEFLLKIKYEGINKNEYDPIWFDLNELRRALIKQNAASWQFEIQEYDFESERWISENTPETQNTLKEISALLAEKHDFYMF